MADLPVSTVRFDDQQPERSMYRLRGVWADWLARFPWTHFGTYTFREERPTARSALGCYRYHGRALARRRGVRNRAFVVVEGDDGPGGPARLHVHTLEILGWDDERRPTRALLSHEEGLHLEAWGEWHKRYGRARVSPLGSDGVGAAYYVAKYLHKTDEPRWWFLPSGGWGAYLPE